MGAKRKKKIVQNVDMNFAEGVVASGLFGSVVGDNSKVHIHPAAKDTLVPEPDFMVTRTKRTPITSRMVTVTAWITALTGLVAAVMAGYRAFAPLIEAISTQTWSPVPSLSFAWFYVFLAGAVLLALATTIGAQAARLRKRVFQLANTPSSWASVGVAERGTVRRYRVRLDARCACGGEVRFYNRAVEMKPVYDENRRVTKEVVSKREPTMECERFDAHRWPFDITRTDQVVTV